VTTAAKSATVLRKLLRKNHVPVGGSWFYTVPETGLQIEDRMSLAGVVAKVQAHYAANSLPAPENLPAIIEDYICSRMPSGVCSGGSPNVRSLDFFSVLGATELLVQRIVKGSGIYVTKEEAARRASICATCPNNLQHMCTTCNGLRTTFQKLVANRTTPFDPKLGVCSACGCGLHAKVHIDKKYLPPMPEDARHTVPKTCWAL
jgi:hypothetical protein